MKTRTKIGIGVAAGAGVALGPLRHRGSVAMAWATRRVRYLNGQIRGQRYRLTGHHPDPAVSDDILADRVRTQLGPVTKKLDVPHVHVMVCDHVVTLHGDVGSADDTYALEEAAAAVSGVRGVTSFLHEGLLRSDSRPSEGAERRHSDAFLALLTAAREAGCREEAARAVVRVVLAGFLEHLREHDRARLTSHLPADVKRLALPPRRTGLALSCVHTSMGTFVSAVTHLDSLSPEVAHDVVVAVLRALRDLIPDEARDIEGHLPIELRDVWDAIPRVSRDDD